jgi:hypothetical protein
MTSQNTFTLAKPGLGLLIVFHRHGPIKACETEFRMCLQPVRTMAVGGTQERLGLPDLGQKIKRLLADALATLRLTLEIKLLIRQG